ncbi:MAG: iron export ABC transporter permease subunit FetB [bacterium]|nr:iron export ABC transporter permease subunit FetB [bacterium]
MNYVSLSYPDLGIAALLVFLVGFATLQRGLGLFRPLMIGATRTAIQLTLVGLVLKSLFSTTNPLWVALMALVMLTAAAREVLTRQNRRFRGGWSFSISAVSMFISAFSVVILALVMIVGPEPWYAPQFSITLLGMMLGNTMNAIGLCMDRLTSGVWQQRREIEGRLLLGRTWRESIQSLRRESIQAGMTPVLNGLATAGIVSLPGMMTGQIMAGADPLEAVKYQILVMFLLAVCTGFGTLLAVMFASRRLFDDRQRLCIDRLQAKRS